MGPWIFRYPESNREIHVSWVDVVDVNGALGEYRSMATRVPDREQAAVLTYAEATYLKYKSLRDDFAAATSGFDHWSRMRAGDKECFALFQARTQSGSGPLAGTLLLRSAWTGDVVVDFVGTNFGVTKYGRQTYANVGVFLVSVAVDVAAVCSARLIWAETARHSREWWGTLLDSKHEFIKFDAVARVRERLHDLIKLNGITHSYKT